MWCRGETNVDMSQLKGPHLPFESIVQNRAVETQGLGVPDFDRSVNVN